MKKERRGGGGKKKIIDINRLLGHFNHRFSFISYLSLIITVYHSLLWPFLLWDWIYANNQK